MSNKYHLNKSREILLDPYELTFSDLHDVLSNILTRKIDWGDLYFQKRQSESWMLENGIVKDAEFSIDLGVGVRAISSHQTGFAYTNDLSLSSIKEASNVSKSIAGISGNKRANLSKYVEGLNLYQPINPFIDLSSFEKVDLLKKLYQRAKNKDSRVSQVVASLSGVYDVILVIASDGTLASDIRPLVNLSVKVIVEDKGKQEIGFYNCGARDSYSNFLIDENVAYCVDEAVRQALINLEAIDAPAGLMPVVLGSGWTGVLLHEAVGHGLEGDFNRKKTSAFFDKLGERVASSVCTIVDDGTIEGRRGSLNVDDEGVVSQYNVLIENGILKGFMYDKLNASLMGVSSTGNGRREAYDCLPIPRMTNTYMLAGNYDPQEIIESVDHGIYAVNFSGGQVDITSGNFVFSTSEAYLIENGKITYPIKNATLIGNGPEVLTKVSMVGNDLELDGGSGVCGKEGQSVPVGVGQPTLKIDELTVGGYQ